MFKAEVDSMYGLMKALDDFSFKNFDFFEKNYQNQIDSMIDGEKDFNKKVDILERRKSSPLVSSVFFTSSPLFSSVFFTSSPLVSSVFFPSAPLVSSVFFPSSPLVSSEFSDSFKKSISDLPKDIDRVSQDTAKQFTESEEEIKKKLG